MFCIYSTCGICYHISKYFKGGTIVLHPKIIEQLEEEYGDLKRQAEKDDRAKLAYADALSADTFIPSYEEAFPIYEELASKGIPEAQHALANCYYHGHGIETDKEQAFEYYKKAAYQEIPQAQYMLAHCFEKAIGTQEDPEQAFYWMRHAALCGIGAAQYEAGNFCQTGYGTIPDEEMAILFYLAASNNPQGENKYAVERCLSLGIDPVSGRKTGDIQAIEDDEFELRRNSRANIYQSAIRRVEERYRPSRIHQAYRPRRIE